MLGEPLQRARNIHLLGILEVRHRVDQWTAELPLAVRGEMECRRRAAAIDPHRPRRHDMGWINPHADAEPEPLVEMPVEAAHRLGEAGDNRLPAARTQSKPAPETV